MNLKRVWEIADEMHIRRHHRNQNQLLKVGGGRGEDSEEASLLVLNFSLS